MEVEFVPVNELDGALGLDSSHRSINILRNDITAVHHAASHVLPMPRVALGHHTGRLEGAICNLRHRQLLVVGLLGRHHRRITRQHEVNSRVWHQVRLKLRDVHIQCSVEAKGSCQRGHHLPIIPLLSFARKVLKMEQYQ